MDIDTKHQILQAIDEFDVSYIKTPDQIIYDIDNDGGILMSISATLDIKQNGKPAMQYAIEVNDQIVEEHDVEQGMPVSKDTQDIIDVMKMCARKVMYQQMTLLQNKYMHHHVYSSKEHS